MIGKELESDRLAQLEIVGAIYLAHAPFAKQTHNSISLEQDCAGNKPGIVDRVVRLGWGSRWGLARVETLRSSIVEYSAATRAGCGVDTYLFRAGWALEVTGD